MTQDPYRPPAAEVAAPAARGPAVGAVLSLSGRAFKRALPLVLGFAAVSGLLNSLPDLLHPGSATDPTTSVIQVAAGLALGMLLGPLTAGAYAWVAARVQAGEPAPLGAALRHAVGRYGRVFGVNLAYTVAVGLGTMACILPGVALSVVLGPMLISAALSPPGTSDWKAGWAAGAAAFWPLAIALVLSWIPSLLISGGLGGVAGAMAVTGQALPGWVALAGGVAAAVFTPLVTTTLAAGWLLATEARP